MGKTTILCVDDDSTMLTALRSLLSQHAGASATIEIAESGEEALEIADDLQKDGQALAVVIADYIMPGMKGDELLVRLHERSPDTVKIMLTGQSDLNGVRRAINEARLYRFLEKPFNNADLVMAVNSAAGAYDQARQTVEEIAQLRAETQALSERLVACECPERKD
ncbi:response regulator [Paucibacter sp. B2R-40]|uniref:response regulator n=1 Tax=Paucibacter sp. B2R-40 TaxID=2893554 RepID=UPI0021E4BAC4|nr:response regulator [Paucibacter sp. B2R-40]MCV2354771.1 response regulator [Paucibacter sp. B2R-40]